MGIEDQRTAVGMTVTLSTQLMAASLAMIAVLGAVATFIADRRQVSAWFYVIFVAAFLSFVNELVFL
jgi:hypothetical protein